MRGKFIVIEGLDGCGKSTQVSLLQQRLQQEGIAYRFIHFPMLNQGADRYVASNIAFQCAKLKDETEKAALKNWILDFEFTHNRLPRPDKTFFLNVPISFIRKSLTNARTGHDRDYLNGKQDIHESSMAFQMEVYKEYIKMTEEGRLQEIRCFDADDLLLSKEDIHQRVLRLVGMTDHR